MDQRRAIIEFRNPVSQIDDDLEIPLDITARDLLTALNEIYHLSMSAQNLSGCCIRMQYPIGLLSGGKVLEKYGVRNGTVMTIDCRGTG